METTWTALAGCAVRDVYGASGRVIEVTSEVVKIGWKAERQILPRNETIGRRDDRLARAVEILTLDRGWCPMSEVVGIKEHLTRNAALIDELQEISKTLDEVKGFRYPFKRKKKLGPGPFNRLHKSRQKHPFDCSCGNYKCTCKRSTPAGGTETKKVKIDKGYKRMYNKKYKAWVAGKGAKAKGKKKAA
jgi:hypothetical protein